MSDVFEGLPAAEGLRQSVRRAKEGRPGAVSFARGQIGVLEAVGGEKRLAAARFMRWVIKNQNRV